MPEDPHNPSEAPTGRDQPLPHPDDETTGRDTGRLLSVSDAADVLGITTDAVRGRIKRRTIRSERRNGSVFAWIEEADQPTTGRDTSRPADDQPHDQSGSPVNDAPDTEIVEVLREQVEYLRDQLQQERDANRENRRIIAGLTQRIPQLGSPRSEAPSQPSSDSPPEASPDEPQEAESGGSSSGRGNVPESSGRPGEGNTAKPQAERPSLWRRIFGVYPSGGSE